MCHRRGGAIVRTRLHRWLTRLAVVAAPVGAAVTGSRVALVPGGEVSVVVSRHCPLPVVVSRRRPRCRPCRDHRRILSDAVSDPATVRPKGPCMGGRCIMTLGGMAKRVHRRGQPHRTVKWALPLKLSCRLLHPHRHRLALPTGRTLPRCCGDWVAPKLKALTSHRTCRSPTARGAGWSERLAPPRTAPCTRLWLMATEMACHVRCCHRCRRCLPGGWCLVRRRSRRRHLGRDHPGGEEGGLTRAPVTFVSRTGVLRTS